MLVHLEGLLEHVSGLVELFSVKVQDAKLGQRLEVVRLPLEHFLEVGDGRILVLGVLLQGLAQAKVRVDGVFVDFESVLEIFSCALTFS